MVTAPVLVNVAAPDATNMVDFKGAHRASGLQINNVMGVTVGPGGYFLNFTKYGLQINHGHEVMMDRCWLGETNFDFNHVAWGRPPNATAIQINGNDHYIVNSIVFSSKVGLEVNGAADKVSGVHVWFPWNHALHYPETMAFHVTSEGNRFDGCYIDGGRAIFEGGALRNNVWTNGFECCAGAAPAPGTASRNGTSGSGIVLMGDHIGPGIIITQNEFGGGSVYHMPTPDGNGAAPVVVGSLIAGNSFNGGSAQGVSTKSSLTLTSAVPIDRWYFDFCDWLLFPRNIVSMQLSVASDAGFPIAVARPPQGNCTVMVETSIPVKGSITLAVDTADVSGGFV